MNIIKTPLTMDLIHYPTMGCEERLDKEPNDHECLNCEWHSDCWKYQTCYYCDSRNYDNDWEDVDGLCFCDDCKKIYEKEMEEMGL